MCINWTSLSLFLKLSYYSFLTLFITILPFNNLTNNAYLQLNIFYATGLMFYSKLVKVKHALMHHVYA
ncbi:hypothetical protein AQUCO_01500359v1 [Aquilegia coerulea]|uniref:Uncharacterized protein n=1 Tax=Aquilegia coerulea TaxID=218851 RepID=A0A2G5DTB2_AQUCA|nr:hypothetical protein AQUCO_01500359v1 [Aquilegia coerulea]